MGESGLDLSDLWQHEFVQLHFLLSSAAAFFFGSHIFPAAFSHPAGFVFFAAFFCIVSFIIIWTEGWPRLVTKQARLSLTNGREQA